MSREPAATSSGPTPSPAMRTSVIRDPIRASPARCPATRPDPEAMTRDTAGTATDSWNRCRNPPTPARRRNGVVVLINASLSRQSRRREIKCGLTATMAPRNAIMPERKLSKEKRHRAIATTRDQPPGRRRQPSRNQFPPLAGQSLNAEPCDPPSRRQARGEDPASPMNRAGRGADISPGAERAAPQPRTSTIRLSAARPSSGRGTRRG